MIVEKKAILFKKYWNSKKPLTPGFKYLVQCDNPDCAKQTWRTERLIQKAARKNFTKQYCNRNCQATHYVGVCSELNCTRLISYRKKLLGKDDGFCAKHSTIIRRKKYNDRTKRELYDILGNICVCCGEADKMYLEIDHVYNDGSAHRKSSHWHPSVLMAYLKENPGGLQILCSNCNRAKHKNGGKLYISLRKNK
jgi:hypothetical protein